MPRKSPVQIGRAWTSDNDRPRPVRRSRITDELAHAIRRLPATHLSRVALLIGAAPSTVVAWGRRDYDPRSGDPRVLQLADLVGVVKVFE